MISSFAKDLRKMKRKSSRPVEFKISKKRYEITKNLPENIEVTERREVQQNIRFGICTEDIFIRK